MLCCSNFVSPPKPLHCFRGTRERNVLFFVLSPFLVCCSREYNLIPAQWKQNIFFSKKITQSKDTRRHFVRGACHILSFSGAKRSNFSRWAIKMRSLSLYQMKVNWLPSANVTERARSLRRIEMERGNEQKENHIALLQIRLIFCVCLLFSFAMVGQRHTFAIHFESNNIYINIVTFLFCLSCSLQWKPKWLADCLVWLVGCCSAFDIRFSATMQMNTNININCGSRLFASFEFSTISFIQFRRDKWNEWIR